MSAQMTLGDRMKMYERREAGRRCMPGLPICARIDGKGFSKFTRSLPRPFDPRLSRLMVDTTRFLVTETGACIGYTQSDEISLVFAPGAFFLDGRIQKLTSILSSMTTGYFNAHLGGAIPEKDGRLALFDCRVWSVPTREEAANVLLWRELDATKNAISMAARAVFSHKQVHGKSGKDMKEMLFRADIDWDAYPAYFKRGTYVQRRRRTRRFTAEEIAKLPPKHAAHQDPDLVVSRTEVQVLSVPSIRTMSDRVGFVFDGVEPGAEE